MLVGLVAGDLLGKLIGVEANVGGVGIAMLLLMVLANLTSERFKLAGPTASGVSF